MVHLRKFYLLIVVVVVEVVCSREEPEEGHLIGGGVGADRRVVYLVPTYVGTKYPIKLGSRERVKKLVSKMQ